MSKTKENVLTENMGELTIRFLSETITASPRPECAGEIIPKLKKLQGEYDDLNKQIAMVEEDSDEYNKLLNARSPVRLKMLSLLSPEYHTTVTRFIPSDGEVKTIVRRAVEAEDVPEAGLTLKATVGVFTDHYDPIEEEDTTEERKLYIRAKTDGVKCVLELAADALHYQYPWLAKKKWGKSSVYDIFGFYTEETLPLKPLATV